MKITAEFNSTEELLGFIKVFGEKGLVTANEGSADVTYGDWGTNSCEVPVSVEEYKNSKKTKKQVEKVTTIKPDKTEKVEKVEAEVVKVEDEVAEVKEVEIKEEAPKVTKEMVREIFTKLIKGGQQKEAKELTTKYGASKLPEVKEEDYAAIYEEAEELL